MQKYECQFCSRVLNYDSTDGTLPAACPDCGDLAWLEYFEEDDPLGLVWRSYNEVME